jgi:hypothetical protein
MKEAAKEPAQILLDCISIRQLSDQDLRRALARFPIL